MNPVLLNKMHTIRNCLNRIHEDYQQNPERLNNFTFQDAIILNIQRACEACIDIAMHVVSEKKLGLPQNSRDAFDLLFSNKIINESLNEKMKAMVGFRNIAVHDYKAMNVSIVKAVIENHLTDFQQFADAVLNHMVTEP